MYSFEAKMWITHPSFSATTYLNDIALIYCPINTYRGRNVDTAFLYMQDPTQTTIFNSFYLNQVVQIAGWGQTSETGGSTSNVLLKADQKIIDLATCQAAVGTATFGPEHLCIRQTGTTVQVNSVVALKLGSLSVIFYFFLRDLACSTKERP
jgi:hypothetical protein